MDEETRDQGLVPCFHEQIYLELDERGTNFQEQC